MITGHISSREAIINLTVRGPAEQEQEIKAIVDTGFDRSLTLPSELIGALNLAHRGNTRVVLADGSEIHANLYAATVIWDSRPRQIIVEQAETVPLVGMALLEGYELRIPCREGGRVIIERLSA